MALRDEDAVRDGYTKDDEFIPGAKQLLGLDKPDADAVQGTGQIKTFNQLGFKGVSDKPDGWYLPKDKSQPAIILETKSEKTDISKSKWVDELMKNLSIVKTQYDKAVGILYNGKEVRVFKGNTELHDISPELQYKSYYTALFNQNKIDKGLIYDVTKRINDGLHFKFGMNDLQDRMIFTACALVAQRYNPKSGLQNLKGMGYSAFHTWIHSALAKAIEQDKRQNSKLDVLLEEYSVVRMSITENQDAINSFIDDVCQIADLVNSDNWNGEDVMAIFFNEFNRYKGKTEAGQVFTPDHVTSFMYRLIEVNQNDRVLDGTCGSGAFLVKAMCNMIKEAGGVNTRKAKEIKSSQLFGIEMYSKIFALACANMMIHKDGKTNLALLNAMSDEAADWIREKNITKVLMNPPYEQSYGCLKIVKNVLDSVPKGTLCAFILPDKKLEKDKQGRKLLQEHSITTIIKMPENLFFKVGITTSIFVFVAGVKQNDKNIIGYYIEDDGLEVVKNQGRQDIKNRWESLENYWVSAIRDGNDFRYNTRQIINPKEHLSYQMPQTPFVIYEEDFIKTLMDYEMYKQGIDVKDFNERLNKKVMYSSEVVSLSKSVSIKIQPEDVK